jgi:hypothetical protein
MYQNLSLNNPHALYKKAYEYLHAGKLDAGFRLFEYRWHPEVMANQAAGYVKPLNIPVWRGECLIGKSITVVHEQGFGDIIQYARFIPALKVLGARKVVSLNHNSLHHLLGQISSVDVFTNATEEGTAVESDFWIGAISLPYYISLQHPSVTALFPLSLQKIVGSEGYFEAIPSNIPRKIGVNWSCSKGIMQHIRTMNPHKMAELTGLDAYSLNPEGEEFFFPLPNDGWKTDWSKTASHIKAMKGVVTVDTATAHLAGALGVKCIVLMPKDEFKCWRWKHGSWYDSVIPVDEKDYDKIPDLIRRM